jgi:acylphosphatase
MKVRAHVFITGRVQGVYFRQNTKRQADSLGVTGWVRNLPDGRVEAVFEGEEEPVKAVVDFCNYGTRNAIVEKVDLTWETYTGEHRDFHITF